MIVIWDTRSRNEISQASIVGVYQYKPMKMIKKWGFTDIRVNSPLYSWIINPKSKKELEIINLKQVLWGRLRSYD